jgi:hypothetical protein
MLIPDSVINMVINLLVCGEPQLTWEMVFIGLIGENLCRQHFKDKATWNTVPSAAAT